MPNDQKTVRVGRLDLGDGWAARVTIDKPAPGGLNIVGLAELRALVDALDGLKQEAGLRAVVLTGGGERAFIGGASIHEMAALTPDSARAFITALHTVCARLRYLPVPVVARIRGYCLGGGLEVAASCDLRVASDDAVFGMPEVKVGIPSVIEAALLPRLIGIGRARELVMTGRTMDAHEALSCGLVEHVTAPDGLDAVVETWLDHIAECGPRALAVQKELCRAWEERPFDEAIAFSIDRFAEAFETGEPQRMMGAFINRRRED